ncbi:MAG: class I SAM-dependent DNA methyltransferase [Rhodanobacter sp.]
MTRPLDPLAARLLQLLPSDGGSMGNGALQRMLGAALGQPVDLDAFSAARDALVSVGALTKGRGRGGSLRLSDGMREAVAEAPALSPPVTTPKPTRVARKTPPATPTVTPPTRTPHMLTGELRSKIDAIWNAFWSGGIANPIEVIEQITYLLFLRRLDDLQLLAENKANRLKQPIERRIFPEGKDDIGKGGGIAYDELRWSRFKNAAPAEMYGVVSEHVFPFLRTLGGDGSTYAVHMKDARFTIPTPALLAKVVDLLDQVPMGDRDTKGDLYEYMLSKIASAGQNGQFRTPRHIIQLMVAMTAPRPEDTICDAACGTAGFLVAAGEYLRDTCPQLLHDAKQREHFHRDAFHGFDFDNTMLRIGSMNMLLHGVENPDIRYRDSLAQENGADEEAYTLVLANPPFAGSLDYENTAKNLLDIVKTKKTELLFLALFLRLLKTGGRAAVIVPDGVLFGSSKAHKELRRRLVEEHKLDAVISLPGGVFKPYAGVSTAILLFTKTNAGGTDHVWFYDVQADGWSLDDKRNPLLGDDKLGAAPTSALSEEDHAKNNLPDVLARWLQRGTGERKRPRTAQSFCVPKADIAAQGYDLSLNRYKEVVHSEVAHRAPQEILTELAKLEAEIAQGMKELEGMLG